MAAGSNYIPTIHTPLVMHGQFEQPAYAQLVAAGVIDTNTLAETVVKGGDIVDIPVMDKAPAMTRMAIESDTEATPTKVGTTNDKGVVLRAYNLMSWKDTDKIRTGNDYESKLSLSFGQRLAEYKIIKMCDLLEGAMQAIDTPSADCHTRNVFNNITGSQPTANLATVDNIRRTRELLADKQFELETILIHSTVFNDLLRDVIETYKIDIAGGQAVLVGKLAVLLGIKNWVITDLMPTRFLANSTSSGAGATVYNTYLLGKGAILTADQAVPLFETERQARVPAGQTNLAMRTHFVMHPRGIPWGGANNPDLQQQRAAASWTASGYQDHREILVAQLVSNGGQF